ncbi:RNA polymerase sigma factor [Zeimonas arvi]|uniref:RNA polymerase sigma factor n=1 Tax=Zeimonas arvi TaxID=2498847 RepID=A0A5C8P0Z4_9BURK|nr:RNA polymerase sigma factor [Zeimonas arvi]
MLGRLSGLTEGADKRLSDEVLAAQASAGDRRAFGDLIRRHQDGVFRFVFRMVGSRDQAMDLTQDSFLKAWQALPGWRPEARFRTWLLQIARNASLDVLRRRSLADFVPIDEAFELPGPGPTPESQAVMTQELRLLEAALLRLQPDHREVLLLRELEGLSYEEIAAVLDVAEGTVKSRIGRARAALLQAWKERHGGHPND